MADNKMIITMGTSLFTSASWDMGNSTLRAMLPPHYGEWCETEILKDPSQRIITDNGVENKGYFEDKLTPGNADNYANILADYDFGLHEEKRYSAELAVILKYGACQAPSNDWKNYLRTFSYRIVFDPTDRQSSTAKSHLTAYLRKLLGIDVVIEDWGIDYLSSINEQNLKTAVIEFYEGIRRELRKTIDGPYRKLVINVTGGYKLYAMYGFKFEGFPNVYTIYMHEKADSVVIMHERDSNIDIELR